MTEFQLKTSNDNLKKEILTLTEKLYPENRFYFLPSISRTNELLSKDKDKNFSKIYQMLMEKLAENKKQRIHFYDNRIFLSLCRKELNDGYAPFLSEPIFEESLQRTRTFNENVGLSSMQEINEFLKTEGEVSLVEVSEDRLREQMVLAVNKVIERKARVIAISGPSSSSKTTTANKLRLALLSKGLRPLRISLDDYYWLPKDAPRNRDGTRDVESINSLDRNELQNEISSLLSGKKTKLRTYHFKDKSADYLREETLSLNQPIILEGIHALNPLLLNQIKSSLIFRIYVSPQPQIIITPSNPFQMSDIRLLRRLVRDKRTRGASYEETLSMWDKVRNEEFSSIYKGQENADFVFDSFFPYEVGVLKRLALPGLKAISKNSPYYGKAASLMEEIKDFKSVHVGIIPIDSSFREFIGKGVFKG